MANGPFDSIVIKKHRGKSAKELKSLGVDALKGVSNSDKQQLQAALNITTISDLATNRFARSAYQILEHSAEISHDRGPDIAWSELFSQAPLEKYQQHPDSFRLDFGPAYYRGRLDNTARILIVGQDPAANELIGHRAFVGASGQRIQAFLRKLGISRDYLMVNTFLYPVFGQFFASLRQLSRDPEILGYRNRVFDYIAANNPLEAVVAAGAAAHDAVERWPGNTDYPIVNITHPSAHDHEKLLTNWNAGVATLRGIVQAESGVEIDTSNYGTDFTDDDHQPIPRYDLPFGMPDWHGVGSHAKRGRLKNGKTNNKEIIWKAP